MAQDQYDFKYGFRNRFPGLSDDVTMALQRNFRDGATEAYVQNQAGLLVPKSVIDAKGDLIVGTAADTVDRLAVGANGSVLTADSAQATGVKWAQNGQRVPSSTTVVTANATSASLASAADSGDLFGNAYSITGNGTNPVLIEVSGYGPFISAGSAGHFDMYLWDGAITSGTVFGGGQFYASATNLTAGSYLIRGYLAAFSGSKTIRFAFRSGVTSQTLTSQASAARPTIITATWLPA